MVKSLALALRLIALPILIAGIILLETERPFPFFRLISFILLFVLLADLTSLLRGKLREALLIATSLAFGLMLIEAVGDIVAPAPMLTTARGFAAHVPVMGWGPGHPGRFHAKKVDEKTGRTIYDVHYTIDHDLLRETQSCASCVSTIAFFGGSFTFGEGLNDSDTLPQDFANAIDRKLRVLNLGFSGYGPQQFLRELQTGRFDKIIGPEPKLFVFLTAPWHAHRAVCKTSFALYAPRYVLRNGKLSYEGQCVTGLWLHLREWLGNMASYRAFIEPYLDRINRADMDAYIRMLVAATHLAKAKYGVPTLIPFIRVSAKYLRPTGYTNDEIIERLKEGGAFVVDVTLASQEASWISTAMVGEPGVPYIRKAGGQAAISIPGDGHPTAYANRLRAAIIKDYIAQHLPSVLTPQPKQAGAGPQPTHE